MNRQVEKARRIVEAHTRQHEMHVLHDDGLYRHVRFAAPDTGIWGFEIVTWPGSLTIRGDIGRGYTFTRTADMFEFFGGTPHRVNPSYWAEKLESACQGAARTERDNAFVARGVAEIRAWALDGPDQHRAILALKRELDYADTLHERYDVVGRFTFTDRVGGVHGFADVWEWDVTGWDRHYLIAVHAIAWAVGVYQSGHTGCVS